MTAPGRRCCKRRAERRLPASPPHPAAGRGADSARRLRRSRGEGPPTRLRGKARRCEASSLLHPTAAPEDAASELATRAQKA
eukprot:scaffold2764_cov399-Prasinococcus_capsulatus_cf.AAC.12